MRIGIDIGGTKIEAAALDADGAICLRRRVKTPGGDYDGIIAVVKALVAAIEAETGARASVGIGIPGALSPRPVWLRMRTPPASSDVPSIAILLPRWSAPSVSPTTPIASR